MALQQRQATTKHVVENHTISQKNSWNPITLFYIIFFSLRRKLILCVFLCSLALFMFHYCALFVRLVLLYVLTIAKTRQQILIKFKIKWQKKRWIVHKFCEEKSYATNACSLVRFNQFWTQKLIRFKVVPSTCRRSRSPSTAQFKLWVMEFFAVILHRKKTLVWTGDQMLQVSLFIFH